MVTCNIDTKRNENALKAFSEDKQGKLTELFASFKEFGERIERKDPELIEKLKTFRFEDAFSDASLTEAKGFMQAESPESWQEDLARLYNAIERNYGTPWKIDNEHINAGDVYGAKVTAANLIVISGSKWDESKEKILSYTKEKLESIGIKFPD